MLELMLEWTFFHELGHIVQQHIRFWETAQRTETADAFIEFDDVDASGSSVPLGQGSNLGRRPASFWQTPSRLISR
jgi:hypothetical protein